MIFYSLNRAATIAKLRFSAPKNDKKKKKEISAQIEMLESDLKIKHDQELKEWEAQSNNTTNDSSDHIVDNNDQDPLIDLNRSTSINENVNLNPLQTNSMQKITKSQRRRENKERKERERLERIKSGLIDDSENTRLIEMKRIESLLEERNMSLCEIPSDGDCMYKAIEHQLRLTRNIDQTVDELRSMASDYIRQNKEDFLPFLLNEENNVVTDQEFEVYCDKIANTKTWGGHLELKALSNTLKVPIEIIQAEGTTIEIGFNEFGSSNPLILWYFYFRFFLFLIFNNCFCPVFFSLPFPSFLDHHFF